MALKDWRKISRRGYEAYYQKKQGDVWQAVSVWRTRFYEVEVIDFADKQVTSPVILDRANFNIKKEAMKYAREYMRSH